MMRQLKACLDNNFNDKYARRSITRDSLFAGRIISILDEIGGGEHEKIWQYISGVHSAEGNYYKLLTKLVERDHPEMLAMWRAEEESEGRHRKL